MAIKSQLEEAHEELINAGAAYQQAEEQLSMARKQATATLNRLNEAQKNFDKVVQAIRKQSPRDSDWRAGREEIRATDPGCAALVARPDIQQ